MGLEFGQLSRVIRLVDQVYLVCVVVGDGKAASGRIEGNAGRLRADGGEGVGLLQAAVEVHREHVGVAEERRLVDLRVDQEQAARDGVVRQAGGIRAAELAGVEDRADGWHVRSLSLLSASCHGPGCGTLGRLAGKTPRVNGPSVE